METHPWLLFREGKICCSICTAQKATSHNPWFTLQHNDFQMLRGSDSFLASHYLNIFCVHMVYFHRAEQQLVVMNKNMSKLLLVCYFGYVTMKSTVVGYFLVNLTVNAEMHQKQGFNC